MKPLKKQLEELEAALENAKTLELPKNLEGNRQDTISTIEKEIATIKAQISKIHLIAQKKEPIIATLDYIKNFEFTSEQREKIIEISKKGNPNGVMGEYLKKVISAKTEKECKITFGTIFEVYWAPERFTRNIAA